VRVWRDRRLIEIGWTMRCAERDHDVRVLVADTIGRVIGKNEGLRSPDVVADALKLVGLVWPYAMSLKPLFRSLRAMR
jgi:hypothetical protein